MRITSRSLLRQKWFTKLVKWITLNRNNFEHSGCNLRQIPFNLECISSSIQHSIQITSTHSPRYFFGMLVISQVQRPRNKSINLPVCQGLIKNRPAEAGHGGQNDGGVNWYHPRRPTGNSYFLCSMDYILRIKSSLVVRVSALYSAMLKCRNNNNNSNNNNSGNNSEQPKNVTQEIQIGINMCRIQHPAVRRKLTWLLFRPTGKCIRTGRWGVPMATIPYYRREKQ